MMRTCFCSYFALEFMNVWWRGIFVIHHLFLSQMLYWQKWSWPQLFSNFNAMPLWQTGLKINIIHLKKALVWGRFDTKPGSVSSPWWFRKSQVFSPVPTPSLLGNFFHIHSVPSAEEGAICLYHLLHLLVDMVVKDISRDLSLQGGERWQHKVQLDHLAL